MLPARRVLVRRTVLFALVLAGLPRTAAAQPNAQTVRLRAYIHSVYDQHDGVPLGSVNRILQTPDGYLWVFRHEGLLRFDGVRFVRPSTPCTEPIQSQAPATDGGFWAVCGEKLIRRTTDARFVVVSQTLPKSLSAHTLFADRQGRVWILGQTIRYLKSDGTGGHVFENPRAPQFFAAAQDTEGTIWATDGSNVFHLYDDRIDRISGPGAAYCITPARTGGILVSTGTSILHLRTGAPPTVVASSPELTIQQSAEGCMREAADGGVWIARIQKGVALVRGGHVELPPGMTEFDRTVTDILIDREGLIWVGSTREVHLFRKAAVQYLPLPAEPGHRRFVYLDSQANLWTGSTGGARRSDLMHSTEHFTTPKLEYRAVGEDEQGVIWLAAREAIGTAINGKFVAVTDASGKPVANVTMFTQDHLGQLWALAPGVGVYRVTPGPPRLAVASSTAARPFLVSERHGLWLATADGALEQHLDGRTTTFPNLNTEPRGDVAAMLEDGDSVWIGSASGVERFRHGQRTRWTHEHGLPDGGVREMVGDRSGHLWMLIGSALVRVTRVELDETPDGQPRTLAVLKIDAFGGGAGVPFPANLRNVPAVTSDRKGRLYGFTNPNTVVIIDPSAVTEPSMKPATVLESVLVDNEPVDHTATNTFVDPARVDFEYTALNFRGAESTRFRYRLDGYDAEWVDARNQRIATYRNLRPGEYRFRVIAQGSEGLWTEDSSAFAFQIVPVFWRTWWFQLSMAVLALSAVAGVYQLRVRQLTRQFNLKLDARVGERTRIARELHDTLLQSFQGLMLHFQSARDLLPSDPAKAINALDTALDRADRAIVEGRDAIQDLRSSTTASHDLVQTIAALAEELTAGPNHETASPQFHMSIEGSPRDLHRIVRDDIHRIAREAVHNAFHHAQANHIEAEVTYGGRELRLRIRDDGKGIDQAHLSAGRAKHYGLTTMRERAHQIGAELSLWSEAGVGTEIELRVPAALAYTTARRS